ncbi:L-threonylcarbamoyladenylate synthase [Candidatus Electrothrix sp.]|uniref:L-threonylcarbamoyladenylate synthase n=1 Tax=Candidatus Electrothrix sp. TaxID=2170559 RepID=UPI004056A3DB
MDNRTGLLISRALLCSASDPAALDQATHLLDQGGLIAFPTETYYGLGVDPFNAEALERLFAMKQRQPDKAVLVLVAEQAQVVQLAAEVPAVLQKLMNHFWPGPLTLVFPGRTSLPALLTGGTGNIGIRHSPHPLASRLLHSFGGPITATSANRSGAPPATTAAEVLDSFGAEIDLILDGGTTPGGAGSTLVGCDQDEQLCCLREGVVAFGDVLRVVLKG